MDVIFEFVVEFVAELYFDFFQSLVPKKNISKGMKCFLTILCAIVSLGMLACIIGGIFLIIEGAKKEVTVGIVLLSVAGVGLLAHIFIAIFNAKKKKNIPEPLDKEDFENKFEK